jgi:hypothetical protein
VLKRLSIILPLLFALLSFKVSASILVLTGGLINTETSATEAKENSIHHYSENGAKTSFEEFIEEQEEEEDSESSLSVYFTFYYFNHSEFGLTRQVKCRKVKRKLFMLYQSYKIDCCKF